MSPAAAAVATFVMILAAGYLLYMYGRIVFGEVSEFLKGLGPHLTDMTPIEVLTLVPLATLIVVFGVQPGLLLDLIAGTVEDTLDSAGAGSAIARGPGGHPGPRRPAGPRHRGADRLGPRRRA